ncbi:hypothetical protein [Helicobacter burdigaliensis]|uniref:hypothetical protein n=1 Tax=Helicobacter burdigaliensis TaxID=2315334 RepID=UPI000EF70C35|nr:hypothetical protein [Helicobacter burdigaliensis]
MKSRNFINLVIFLGSFFTLWVFFGKIFVLNFAFAFLSFLFVVLAVFYTQKRKINALISNASNEELEALAKVYETKAQRLEEELWEEEEKKEELNLQSNQSDNQEKKESKEVPLPKKRRFWHNFDKTSSKLGMKMFFVPLRLLAYAFLVVGFLVLLKNEMLDLWGFFSGLILANVLVVLNLVVKIK